MPKKTKPEPKPTNRGRIPDKILQGIIEDLKNNVPEAVVAEKYNRPIEQIMKVFETHIKPFLNVSNSGSDQLALIQRFKNSREWIQFNEEFSKDEMEMFLYEYCKLMADFSEDEIKKAEENQLFMSIRYWILMHRNMKDRKRTDVELSELDDLIKKIYKEGVDAPAFNGDQDKFTATINMLSDKRGQLQSSQISKTSEHKSLTEKHQKFMEDLKVTRNQRIDRFEQKRNLNFLDVIKELEDEDNRRSTGLQMELVKEAMNKQEKEWGKITRYSDNELDRMVLDSDTIDINEYADGVEGEIHNG